MEQVERRGHVFVAHTKLENLQYDAVVIPTDHWLNVEPYWGPALGVDAGRLGARSLGEALKPPEWVMGETTWAPVPEEGRKPEPGREKPTPAWFLAVGRSRDTDDVEWLIGNLTQVLGAVVGSDVKVGAGRARPLVALTTLGVGKGGFEQERGEVIRRLLAAAQEFAAARGVDIVFAVTNAADYAAFQQQRRGLESFPSLSDQLRERGKSLAEMAKAGELALFIGAGVSMSAGLPSWGELLESLRRAAGVRKKDLKALGNDLDRAEHLSMKLSQKEVTLQNAIRTIFGDGTKPGLSHVQLAALGCREAVTTNYDSLYESAFNATRPEGERVKVLPFEQKKPFDHWILKMHGDLTGGDIVLTRSDFVGYENAFGPVGAIVQSLLLTRHLLVVGASMTDDNLLRLAYEVAAYLRRGDGDGAGQVRDPFGTILALGGSAVKKDFWKGKFDYLGVSQSTDREEQTRDLSIMLDFIAMHAAEADHLLNKRYETLLEEPEVVVAEQSRRLARAIDSLTTRNDPGWARLRLVLSELGAQSS